MIHGISKTWLRDLASLGSAVTAGDQAIVIYIIDLHGLCLSRLISYMEAQSELFGLLVQQMPGKKKTITL